MGPMMLMTLGRKLELELELELEPGAGISGGRQGRVMMLIYLFLLDTQVGYLLGFEAWCLGVLVTV